MRIAQDKIIKQILYDGAGCRRLVFDDNEDFATMFSLSRRRLEGEREKEVGIGRKKESERGVAGEIYRRRGLQK